jgi:hypothetical protein
MNGVDGAFPLQIVPIRCLWVTIFLLLFSTICSLKWNCQEGFLPSKWNIRIFLLRENTGKMLAVATSGVWLSA